MAPTLSTTPTRAVLEELFPIGQELLLEGAAKDELNAIRLVSQLAQRMTQCVAKPDDPGKFADMDDDLPDDHPVKLFMQNPTDGAKVAAFRPDANLPRGLPGDLDRMMGGIYFLRRFPSILGAVFDGEGDPRAHLFSSIISLVGSMRFSHTSAEVLLTDLGLWVGYRVLQGRYPDVRWPVAQYIDICVDTERCVVTVRGYKI